MTRINVGIDPKELPNKLLLAEHREITRIPNAIKNKKIKLDLIPKKFTLGTGHVRFFYDKILFLKLRYENLYKECLDRNFNVINKIDSFEGIPIKLFNNYLPTEEDRSLLIERITNKGFFLL